MTVLVRDPKHAPRALFSVSQVEKAFGSGWDTLTADPYVLDSAWAGAAGSGVLGPEVTGSDHACLRTWGLRYLAGFKEPELTWEQACALPEGTDEQRRYKSGAKARTWGKVAEVDIERFIKRDPSIQSRPLSPHVVAGLNLLPHPEDLIDYELQAPVNVATTPEAIGWAKSAIAAPGIERVSWQGFKDFRGATRAANGPDWGRSRFLIDFKTTKPKVDNAYNAEHGRPPGTWRYLKRPEQLLLDWQYNLYTWDDYLKFGSLPIARWVYFASPGSEKYPNRPEAHATDMIPEITPGGAEGALEIVRAVVRSLDARGRVLLGHVRAAQALDLDGRLAYALALPENVSACEAFGGCPHHARLGGPCSGGGDRVIPIGSLLAKKKPRASKETQPHPGAYMPAFEIVVFPQQTEKGPSQMDVMQQIQAQIAANNAAAQASAGAPPAQAPPGALPWQQPAPAGPPVFQPQAFNPAPQAPAPQAPAPGAFGSPAAPGWLHDGQGGYVPQNQIPAMAQAGHPGAQALMAATPGQAPPVLGPLSPVPPAFVPPSPTPGLPPEAFVPGGPAGPPLAAAPMPTGAPVPPVPPVATQPPPLGPAVPGAGKKRGPKSAAEKAALEGGQAPGVAPDVWERIAVALERIADRVTGS